LYAFVVVHAPPVVVVLLLLLVILLLPLVLFLVILPLPLVLFLVILVLVPLVIVLVLVVGLSLLLVSRFVCLLTPGSRSPSLAGPSPLAGSRFACAGPPSFSPLVRVHPPSCLGVPALSSVWYLTTTYCKNIISILNWYVVLTFLYLGVKNTCKTNE
jgi:hypothetical protein